MQHTASRPALGQDTQNDGTLGFSTHGKKALNKRPFLPKLDSAYGITWSPNTVASQLKIEFKTPWCDTAQRLLSSCIGRHMTQMRTYERDIPSFDAEALFAPIRNPDPTLYFVRSDEDLFSSTTPNASIEMIVETMRACPHHRFQILTEEAERLVGLQIAWPTNVWLGVSVTSPSDLHRVRLLGQVRAATKWVATVPVYCPLTLSSLSDVDWVVASSEHTPCAPHSDPDCARQIRDKCLAGTRTAFYLANYAGAGKKSKRVLDGHTWAEMPMDYNRWLSSQP